MYLFIVINDIYVKNKNKKKMRKKKNGFIEFVNKF